MSTYRSGLVRPVLPGAENRAYAHQGSPGTWDALPFPPLQKLAEGLPDPKAPGRRSASDLTGANTGARGGPRRAKETKCDGQDARESERLIVPTNRGNDSNEPRGGKEVPGHGTVGGKHGG